MSGDGSLAAAAVETALHKTSQRTKQEISRARIVRVTSIFPCDQSPCWAL
jgi:hypothetical protein